METVGSIDAEIVEREPYDDPFDWFSDWWAAANELEIQNPNAMTLATVSPEGHPRARTILLKDWDREGFVFYTNYRSAKGEDLGAEPRATLQAYWRQLDRQIRIEGEVDRLPPEESDAYFSTRPRGSQLGAWASNQSEPIASRELLERAFERYREKFEDEDVPRPPHWGGFRLRADRFRFWRAGDDRLHDRWLFDSGPDGDWARVRLAP